MKEIFVAIIGIFFGHITTKIGISVLLQIIGLAFLLAPVIDGISKPIALDILGIICLVIGLILFISKVIEIWKRKRNN